MILALFSHIAKVWAFIKISMPLDYCSSLEHALEALAFHTAARHGRRRRNLEPVLGT